MSKKVLVIGTSLRKEGNSNRLVQEFAKGAKDAGNEVDIEYLYNKKINFCKGCLACQRLMHCVIDDDTNAIVEKMKNSDIIAFATPIYFYEMCGQMKTLLDRSNPLFPSKYCFRDIYLLASAADTGEYSMDGAIKGLQGWIDCFSKTKLKGVVKALGAEGVGAVEDGEALKEAYAMGKAV